MQIRKWSDDYASECTAASLRREFPDKVTYRVSVNRYEPGVRVSGAMIPARCFVFVGTVACCFGGEDVTLSAGEYIDAPQGSYHMEAQGSAAAEVGMVLNVAAAIEAAARRNAGPHGNSAIEEQ